MRKPPPEFPTILKAGVHNFRIVKWDHREASGRQCYGETCDLAKLIKVDTEHGSRKAATTLFHEILHVAFVLGNVADEDKEERTVKGLEVAVTAIWRDNPAVFAYIHYYLQHGD